MESNNRTSILVSSQVPEFVRRDHPKFIEFMEAYYQFLEQEGQLSDITKKQTQDLNIDLTNDTYREKFYDNFLNILPKDIVADKNLVLKKSKDFLRSRGTEKSYSYLFKVLYDKEPTFYYPKSDILKASDGKWFVEKSIRIVDTEVDNVSNTIAYSNFVNHTIYGSQSNASAKVEGINSYYSNKEIVTELLLSDQVKQFYPGEKIFTYYVDPTKNLNRYLTANILSGYISTVNIVKGGTGYTVGTIVPLDNQANGTGAVLQISATTTGNLRSIVVLNGGAGFEAGDNILVSGGQAPGASLPLPATAQVLSVIKDGYYHPNSYNMVATTISTYASNLIGDTYTSNTYANTVMSNTFTFWQYSNTGPINQCSVINHGANYTQLPTFSVSANSIIRSLGILGRMEIYDGGLAYQNGDIISFDTTNPVFDYGFGANAVVSSVAANGRILAVQFVKEPGQIVGGSGYNQNYLPTVNIHSVYGHSANIAVTSVLGQGQVLLGVTDAIGRITEIKILNGGTGYTTPPTPNLTSFGDGTAVANTTVFTGTYTYKGRYLNDDGKLSSYKYLQNKDYYQNYSYVVRVDESINKYRQLVKDILHPAGMKLLGEYITLDETMANLTSVAPVNTRPIVFNTCTYQSTGSGSTSNVRIDILVGNQSYYSVNTPVSLLFRTGNTANANSNGVYKVVGTGPGKLFFTLANAINSTGNVYVSKVLAS